MKRRFQGLASTMKAEAEIADGVFLVRVDQVRYAKERQKPFYALRFSVLEPTPWVGRAFSARLYARLVEQLWVPRIHCPLRRLRSRYEGYDSKV